MRLSAHTRYCVSCDQGQSVQFRRATCAAAFLAFFIMSAACHRGTDITRRDEKVREWEAEQHDTKPLPDPWQGPSAPFSFALDARCDQGEVNSCVTLAGLYRTGSRVLRVPQNTLTAAKYLSFACERRHQSACHALGRMYRSGELADPDGARALFFFAEACRLGHRGSCSTASAESHRYPAQPDLTPEGGAGPTESQRIGLGSCFAVALDGTLVTSAHVVEDAKAIAVIFPGHDPIPASVKGRSEATDLAVLSVDARPPDYLGIARKPARLGLDVFTVGFPRPDVLGVEPKFAGGSISSLSGRGDASFMQITVPIQQGNSGGPLVNDRGEVVGIVAAKAALGPFLAGGTVPENVNFAAKAENLRALLNLDATTPRRAARTREEAIERATDAVCLVVTME